MNNSIVDIVPKLAVAGLATVTIFVQSSTGQVNFPTEYHHKSNYKNESLKLGYVAQKYGFLSNIEINEFNSEVQSFIGNDDTFKQFLTATISSLQNQYTVFGSSIEVINDPNEGYEQLRINIFSVDEDKFEKYISFIDSWAETAPPEYLNKIVLLVA